MAGETMGERMVSVEGWIEGHERACDERQEALGREIRDLKRSHEGLTKGAWGIVLAVLAWMSLQLYSDLKRPGTVTTTAVSVSSPQPAPAPRP